MRKELWRVLSWVVAFGAVQMMSGCIVLEQAGLLDPKLVTVETQPFKGEDLADYVWFEDGDPKISVGLVLRIGLIAGGSQVGVEEMIKEVNMNGDILLGLLGPVQCAKLTIFELQAKLEEQYKNYYHDPQVTVSFAYTPGSGLKSPWGSILVMGAVGREGPVDMPSTRDLTVIRVLMLAGGVTPLGDKSKVRVARRTEAGDLLRYRVNVEKIGRYGRYDLDLKLRPGDVVWVPETWY
ncbi:MAG: polysaccharide biosynthesis/export family protein [Kiritimatiellaeota bacterium]|nr:polysaccharide biosynthesis/export family protein [Kiritimatiellota bacterium]